MWGDMIRKILKKEINILGRKVTVLKLVVIISASLFLLNLGYNFKTMETMEGEFIQIVYIPRSDGCGNDAILYFLIDDTYHYLVLNSYKPGLMLELDYHKGDTLKFQYGSSWYTDYNVGISYEVIE